jgi:hypothetical protein
VRGHTIWNVARVALHGAGSHDLNQCTAIAPDSSTGVDGASMPLTAPGRSLCGVSNPWGEVTSSGNSPSGQRRLPYTQSSSVIRRRSRFGDCGDSKPSPPPISDWLARGVLSEAVSPASADRSKPAGRLTLLFGRVRALTSRGALSTTIS